MGSRSRSSACRTCLWTSRTSSGAADSAEAGEAGREPGRGVAEAGADGAELFGLLGLPAAAEREHLGEEGAGPGVGGEVVLGDPGLPDGHRVEAGHQRADRGRGRRRRDDGEQGAQQPLAGPQGQSDLFFDARPAGTAGGPWPARSLAVRAGARRPGCATGCAGWTRRRAAGRGRCAGWPRRGRASGLAASTAAGTSAASASVTGAAPGLTSAVSRPVPANSSKPSTTSATAGRRGRSGSRRQRVAG